MGQHFRPGGLSGIDSEDYREVYALSDIAGIIIWHTGIAEMSYSYNQGIDSLVVAAEKEVPDFQFANGELEVYADMPIIIDGEGTGHNYRYHRKTDATILQDMNLDFYRPS